MKSCFSLTVTLCLWSFLLRAQDRVVKTEKFVLYKPFKSFFEKHKELREIHFYKEWATDSLELDMIEKDMTVIKAFNHFDLDNAGDRYFFQKRFGSFNLPPSLYEGWLDAKADCADIWGSVRRDSVFFTIQEVYHSKNDSEKYFIKIEAKWEYSKGLHILAKELEAKLSCLDVPANDSIIVVKYLLEKDGRLTYQKVEKGNIDNNYTKELVKCLNASGPWIPYQTGGFKVRSYIKIYVRLNADKTYQIAMD